MKRFKNVSFVLSAILLAGFVTFSACKKDDDKLSGTQAAKELCDCYQKTGTALINCISDFTKKYNAYIDIDKEEYKDKAFGEEFDAEIVKCDFDFGEDDE